MGAAACASQDGKVRADIDFMQTDAHETEHADECVTLILQRSRQASILSILSALLTLAVLGIYQLTAFLATWTLGVTAIALVRLLMHRKFIANAASHPTEYWSSWHKWTGAISGAAWGLLALAPTQEVPTALQTLTLLVPAIVATGALTTYAIVLSHYRAYLFSLTLTLFACQAFVAGINAYPSYLMFGILSLTLYRTARIYHANMVEGLAAHKNALKQADELKDAQHHLQEQRSQLEQEEDIARHVFHQLTLASENDSPGIHTWNQPMGNLSGDLIQVAHGPENQVYIFLGDFTGHGLPAALGAVPASTVFQAMVNKGMRVEEIARELNRKLHDLLPTGYFCCAVIIELSADRSHIESWNGGLPPIVVNVGNSEQIIEIPGANLPLGVVADKDFMDNCISRDLHPGDEIYVYSDGLTEAENDKGEMWGKQRFLEFLSRDDLPAPRIDSLKNRLLDFTNLAPPSDDISIIEIEATPAVRARDVA